MTFLIARISNEMLADFQCYPVDEDKESVTIVVYAENEKRIDAGIQSLENILDDEFQRKEFCEDCIHELTQSQVCLQRVMSTYTADYFFLKYEAHVSSTRP